MNWLLPAWILAAALVTILVQLLRAPRPVYAPRPRGLANVAVAAPLPASLATADSSEDVVSFLKHQHDEIKALFAETLAARGDEREVLFGALRRLIATHEATEEELFHPAAQRALGPRGYAIVSARMGEERAAATAITSIERIALDTMRFEMELRKLQADVERHATHEEVEEFPALAGVDASALRKVSDVARTLYADPSALTHGDDRDIGPFMALLNQTRELLGGKQSLPVPEMRGGAPTAAE
jgi:hypothetical protein